MALHQSTLLFVSEEKAAFIAFETQADALDYSVKYTPDFISALKMLHKHHLRTCALILHVGEKEPDAFTQFITEIKSLYPHLPIILQITGRQFTLVEAFMALGIDDFWVEPMPLARIQMSLLNAIRLQKHHKHHKMRERETIALDDFIANSIAMRQAVEKAKQFAPLSGHIFIYGEHAVGKTDFARAIFNYQEEVTQQQSHIIHCASQEECAMLSSWLKTQDNATIPIINRAKMGATTLPQNLILDEVAMLPLSIQQQLVAFLEAQKPKTPFRIIATSSQDLALSVQQKTFEQRLFDILNILTLSLPPLRHRIEDIADLCRLELSKLRAEAGGVVRDVSLEGVKCLASLPWQGNLSTLRYVIWRAALYCNDLLLDADNIQKALHHLKHETSLQTSSNGNAQTSYASQKTISAAPLVGNAISPSSPLLENVHKNAQMIGSKTAVNPDFTVAIVNDNGRLRPYSEIEEEVYAKVVRLNKGNISEAAKILKIGRSTLYRKLN